MRTAPPRCPSNRVRPNPATGLTQRWGGVLLQEHNLGLGSFMSLTNSGTVRINPPHE